jgi:hypothetical protein
MCDEEREDEYVWQGSLLIQRGGAYEEVFNRVFL